MGRQVQLHMLADDTRMLCDFIAEHGPAIFTLKSDQSPEAAAVPDPSRETHVMAIWNRILLPSFERKLVRRPEEGDYYRADESLPLLELSPSRLSTWGGKPALEQGRIYGFFGNSDKRYSLWYDSITRWVRRHFARNPVARLGGYIGPSASAWFEKGGILLPMFNPPSTPEWASFVESQHQSVNQKAS